MGAANSDAKLYDDEIQAIAQTYPDQFRVDYALSREQKNKRGGGCLLQDAVLVVRPNVRMQCVLPHSARRHQIAIQSASL